MDPYLKITPQRQQVLSFALTQSLAILQMPQQELSQWLLEEIEKNPLLELSSHCPKKRFDLDVAASLTLYEHLHNQIRESFSDPKDQLLAEIILEQLDERGFIGAPMEEITNKPFEKVLSVLQTFDPPGIFARNLQEALLIQLKNKKKSDSVAFRVVESCFEELLHGRFSSIKKKLHLEDLKGAIKDLARLSFRPANAFQKEPISSIYPDMRIVKIEGGWTVELIDDDLPKFYINYLDLRAESVEEKEALKDFKTGAKWLVRSLSRRKKLLLEIGRILICKQSRYLDQKGALTALSVKEIAEKLQVHESTLSRALSDKYVETPRGVIALRSLISNAPEAVSSREILESLIRNEDKKNPLTDEALAESLKEKGFPVARRTIAKYRNLLKIGSATQRKHR